MRSARKCAISRSLVSRSASMARRSVAEICAAISASAFTSVASGRPSVAELERADQPAMHDQVGIAADRRGEMRVAAQVQAEMAVILRRVFGLRLRAQHDLVDELLGVAALDLGEDAVEGVRPQHAAFGERNVERGEELAQRVDLFHARLVVHAIDQRHARLFQRLGGGDIGEDHEFLDQPVRLQPLRRDHAVDGAVALEQDLALRQIEIERPAFAARAHRALRRRRRAGRAPARPAPRCPRRCARRWRIAPAGRTAWRPSASCTRWKVCERLRPSAPITMRTASAARSSRGRSEHRSLEMRSGSIGTTRSGK